VSKIRTGQLLAPFGIGQIISLPNNVSFMVGGLNLWEVAYTDREVQARGQITFDRNEFEISEPRLSRVLNNRRLFKPFSWQTRGNSNTEIPIYGVRFPKWHYCAKCRKMKEMPLRAPAIYSASTCVECKGNMIPVRFVAICQNGHIEDVPFMRWAHRGEPDPGRAHSLMYIETGGSGDLGDIILQCECGDRRSLAGITRENALSFIQGDEDEHTEEDRLDHRCNGLKPWTGSEEPSTCGENLQVVLKGASNVHFSKMVSSIYIPENNEIRDICDKIIDRLTLETLKSYYKLDPDDLMTLGIVVETQPELKGRIEIKGDILKEIVKTITEEEDRNPIDEVDYRLREYQVFSGPDVNQTELVTKSFPGFTGYTDGDFLNENFEKVVLVEKLRETSAFVGFTRRYPDSRLTREQLVELLSDEEKNWLPGYVVLGEGLFFQFKKDKIERWKKHFRENVQSDHVERYHSYRSLLNPNYETRSLDEVFVFIHTFAHLLIKRLCYNCGYGSTSLKERLYFSNVAGKEMNGVLIYTASSDSSGSLGGLVNQGRQALLAKNVREAIEDASWCSADPVCMDVGLRSGQGPGSSNGAACHNCAVIAETSCEEFNLLLDRSTVVGSLERSDLGYFSFK
jgi:hypothetical protein